jgi:hypothetical protein
MSGFLARADMACGKTLHNRQLIHSSLHLAPGTKYVLHTSIGEQITLAALTMRLPVLTSRALLAVCTNEARQVEYTTRTNALEPEFV